MKLTAVFVFVLSLSIYANSYGQSERVNLVMKSSLRDVIEKLEQVSGYHFVLKYDAQILDREVYANYQNEKIDLILDDLLRDTGYTYKIIDRYIAISADINAFAGQQSSSVSGKVTDSSRAPLPGVSIVVKGTTQGTITDADGFYSLNNVSADDAILVFSFVGMKTQEIAVSERSIVNAVLIEESIGIEEVVAIGYSSTSRKNIASAFSSVNNKEIIGLSVSDVRQTLQGKMAGVQVINNSGNPGSGARIIIRGMGSFSNPDPLYVLDGIQGGDINSVAPQDIENITILKDAASTAIYGSAAANGVILITTKSGTKGKLKVQYDGSIGVATFTKRFDMLGTSDYIDLVADIQKAGGLSLTEKLLNMDRNIPSTDWQDVIFRNALVTDHNIRLSGGGENTNYMFSAGYINQQSTIIARTFQRATIGIKLDQSLFNKKIRLAENLHIKNDVEKGALASTNDALLMPPYIPVLDPTNLGGYGRCDKVTDLTDANNPANSVYNTNYVDRGLDVSLDLSLEVDILSGLVFKTQGRLRTGNDNNYTFRKPAMSGNSVRLQADMTEYYNNSYYMLWENLFNYNKQIGAHMISATLGNSYGPPGFYRSVTVAGSAFTSDAIENIALANSNSITGSSVNSGKSRLSYFGRIGYTFMERYIFNISARRDASSVFGANNRWGNFYGLGFAWSVTSEDFMKTISTISNLKLRLSYGKTGNDNIPAFLTSSTIWKGDANNIVYSFGDGSEFSTGSTVNSIPNPDLRWEETLQTDVGVDIGLFKNKLNIVFDYYNRDNKDLLIETQLPLTTGLGNPNTAGTMWVNAASMKNTGFESTINYSDNSRTFKWDISANLTYSTNEVTALGTVGDLPISKGDFGHGNSTRTDIGHPLGSYYGYVVDHVAKDQNEIDALNAETIAATDGEMTEYKAGMRPGDFIFKDVTGDGFVDDKDRTYIGNPTPKWQYGGAFNGYYKAFDIQILFQGIANVDVANGSRPSWEGMLKPFNQTTAVLDRWRKEGDLASLPAAGQNSSVNLAFSSWYIESGAYFRIKNLTLGYTLPSSMFRNIFSKFRLFVSAQNLLTITKYSGYDPEISSYSYNDNDVMIFARGVDQYQRPNPTTYRIGLQLNF